MKVAIYGAGAIGGWMGVKLAQAGHDRLGGPLPSGVEVPGRGVEEDHPRQVVRGLEGGVQGIGQGVGGEQVEGPALPGVQPRHLLADQLGLRRVMLTQFDLRAFARGSQRYRESVGYDRSPGNR